MRRTLKVLHELAAVGMMGSLAACVVLILSSTTDSPAQFAAIRHAIALVHKFLYLPSLALALISGLLAIAATRAYQDAGWAWIKALTGVSMFEGSLLTIVGPAKKAAVLAEQALSGAGDPAALAHLLHTEWSGTWVMLALATANVVLGVWRPRFGGRSQLQNN